MTDEISIKVWIKQGGMLVRADALDWDDPGHPYNQIKEMGKIPEEYGYFNPKYDKYKDWTVNALIDRIEELEKEIKYFHGGYVT